MATSNLPEPPTAALSQTPYSVDLSLENLALRLRDLHVSSSGREENEENSGSDQRMISSGGNNNGVSFNGGDVSYQIMVNSMDSGAVKRKIAELALDPYGSMLLKQKLMKNDKQITDVVFNAVFRYMFEVMVHPCGAHVFGKLLECCDQSQLQLVVTKISLQSQTFLESLFNMPGTNCAKRLIEALENSPLISEIISILVFAFVPVMTDQVASSVVMKCFDILNVRQNQTEIFKPRITEMPLDFWNELRA
ncbi:hypothetical protein TIFTF001_011832 [Ficus carica]|uniref:PUM-HD domain-containing protein n=1 Tax=Ficus carica TaxID=3494 RepID=A0AA88D5R0_FICCA|nr:hypothetical protein TIFTF001_011832 [Ficus carica]